MKLSTPRITLTYLLLQNQQRVELLYMKSGLQHLKLHLIPNRLNRKSEKEKGVKLNFSLFVAFLVQMFWILSALIATMIVLKKSTFIESEVPLRFGFHGMTMKAIERQGSKNVFAPTTRSNEFSY